jgi:thioredoxin 1
VGEKSEQLEISNRGRKIIGKPIVINDSNFDQMVLHAEAVVLVDFWAPSCRPCLMVAPVLDELAEEYDGRITIARLDVDQNPRTAVKYSIMSIPSLLIFKEGKPMTNIVGFRPKAELKRSLEAILD